MKYEIWDTVAFFLFSSPLHDSSFVASVVFLFFKLLLVLSYSHLVVLISQTLLLAAHQQL